jgi:hypothetical protein
LAETLIGRCVCSSFATGAVSNGEQGTHHKLSAADSFLHDLLICTVTAWLFLLYTSTSQLFELNISVLCTLRTTPAVSASAALPAADAVAVQC